MTLPGGDLLLTAVQQSRVGIVDRQLPARRRDQGVAQPRPVSLMPRMATFGWL